MLRPTPPCPGRPPLATVRRALRPDFRLALALVASLALAPPLAAAQPKAKAVPTAQAQPAGQTLEISGRVAAGLDKVFIKDPAQGYFLVQGANLAPYSGRQVTAAGVVVGQNPEYRTLRLVRFRIQSPDDEGPGAAGSVSQGVSRGAAQAGARRKK